MLLQLEICLHEKGITQPRALMGGAANCARPVTRLQVKHARIPKKRGHHWLRLESMSFLCWTGWDWTVCFIRTGLPGPAAFYCELHYTDVRYGLIPMRYFGPSCVSVISCARLTNSQSSGLVSLGSIISSTPKTSAVRNGE